MGPKEASATKYIEIYAKSNFKTQVLKLGTAFLQLFGKAKPFLLSRNS